MTLLVACGGDDSSFLVGADDSGPGTSDGGTGPGDGGTGPSDGGTGTDGGPGDGGAVLTLGGTVSGLAGTGLTLQNGSATLAVNANGGFTFPTPVAAGAAYVITVATQPTVPTQNCTVANGSGTVTANVTNVTVTCVTSQLTIGGTVMGLAGTGLVLQDNNGDKLTVTANGAFTFATPVASGSAFSVSVLTQPATPSQACSVNGGTGTVGSANVTDVVINCSTDMFVIGGQISGLAGANVVLQDNGGDNLTVTANGTFAFATPIASGGAYAVTVLTQPSSPSQTCTVSTGTGTGTVTTANVTTVSVTCSTNTYTIGVTIAGLGTNNGAVLQDNGGDNLSITANGTYTFATPVASGAAYAVTVLSESGAPAQTCAVANTGTAGTGTVGAGNVTGVTVNCTINTYTIGGTVTGSATGLVLQDNGTDSLTFNAAGTFTFATPIPSGGGYAVTVLTNPSNVTCTVTSGGTGTVTNANVVSVVVTCLTDQYPSTGADGAFAPTTNTVLPAGTYNFTTITIPAGVTVTTNGTGVLDLRATGAVSIVGTLNLSGGTGGGSDMNNTLGGGGGDTGAPTTEALGAPGKGGLGAQGVATTTSAAEGAFGGGVGASEAVFGGGGGGGYAGGGGGSAPAPGGVGGTGGGGTPAQQGGAAGVAVYNGGNGVDQDNIFGGGGGGSIGATAAADLPVATTFQPGSAGGGGGGDNYTGGGGGGGGGALRLASPVSISIAGSVLATGGAGGSGNGWGDGGGGSGGVVFLYAPSLTVSAAATISAAGGAGGTGSIFADVGGAGGLGRIRLSVSTASCTLAGTITPALQNACAVSPAAGAAGFTYVASYPQ